MTQTTEQPSAGTMTQTDRVTFSRHKDTDRLPSTGTMTQTNRTTFSRHNDTDRQTELPSVSTETDPFLVGTLTHRLWLPSAGTITQTDRHSYL